jgi:hypothetical protein
MLSILHRVQLGPRVPSDAPDAIIDTAFRALNFNTNSFGRARPHRSVRMSEAGSEASPCAGL